MTDNALKDSVDLSLAKGEAHEIPHNTSLEKALLGAILYDNDQFDNVMKVVDSEHFYSPINRKLFQCVEKIIGQNRLANVETVRPYLVDDAAIREVGIGNYLGDITSYYVNPDRALEYARQIRELAQLRGLIGVGDKLVESARVADPDRPPEIIIEETENALYQLRKKGQPQSGFRPMSNTVIDAVVHARQSRDRSGSLGGLSTGLIDLDKKLGTLQPSDLIVIAARPSMGKTALATNIAQNVARNYKRKVNADGTVVKAGGKVAIFSLEMSSLQLTARILASASGVPASDIRYKKISENEFQSYAEAARDYASVPLYIDDTGGISISELTIRAQRLNRDVEGLDLIVVDYIQLMKGSKPNANRTYEIAEITGGLKSLAKELNIPIIGISQLNRMLEGRDDKRPQLSDLKDSGSIEQDADVVLFVFRQSYYHARSKPDEADNEAMEKWQAKGDKYFGKADIIVDKNRNGPIGKTTLKFEDSLTKFSDLAPEDQVSKYTDPENNEPVF